jgi:hypothetical protein
LAQASEVIWRASNISQDKMNRPFTPVLMNSGHGTTLHIDRGNKMNLCSWIQERETKAILLLRQPRNGSATITSVGNPQWVPKEKGKKIIWMEAFVQYKEREPELPKAMAPHSQK